MWIILIYIFLGLYLPTITRSHHWHYESMIWFSSHCNTAMYISMSGWGEEHFHCHTGPLGLETSDIFNPAAKNQRSMTASCHVSVERCYYIMISEKVYSYFRMIICLGSFLMSLYCVKYFQTPLRLPRTTIDPIRRPYCSLIAFIESMGKND